MPDTPSFHGLDRLVAWFGRVPSFHDAELLELVLGRDGSATMVLHAWNMSDRVDENGYYLLERNAVVTLRLEKVASLSIRGIRMPSIVFGLEFATVDGGIEVSWDASYGIDGQITARSVSAELVPGRPTP